MRRLFPMRPAHALFCVLLLSIMLAPLPRSESSSARYAKEAEGRSVEVSGGRRVPVYLMYQFFFDELAAHERESAKHGARPDGSPSQPAHHQHVLGLNREDYEYFRRCAAQTAAALDENRRRSRALASAARDHRNPAAMAEIGRLSADSRSRILRAIGEIHSRLGEVKFSEADKKLCAYIAGGLKIRPLGRAENPISKKGD